MSAHTPGPWQAVDGYKVYSSLGADSGDGAKANSDDGWCICICKGDEVPMTGWGGTQIPLGWSPVLANARLIAAAPELLEALQDLMDTGFTGGPQGKRARAAIAKATGEAP